MAKFRLGRLTHHQTLMPDVFKHLPDWKTLSLLYFASRGSRTFLLKELFPILRCCVRVGLPVGRATRKMWSRIVLLRDLLHLLTGVDGPWLVDLATVHEGSVVICFDQLIARVS